MQISRYITWFLSLLSDRIPSSLIFTPPSRSITICKWGRTLSARWWSNYFPVKWSHWLSDYSGSSVDRPSFQKVGEDVPEEEGGTLMNFFLRRFLFIIFRPMRGSWTFFITWNTSPGDQVLEHFFFPKKSIFRLEIKCSSLALVDWHAQHELEVFPKKIANLIILTFRGKWTFNENKGFPRRIFREADAVLQPVDDGSIFNIFFQYLWHSKVPPEGLWLVKSM